MDLSRSLPPELERLLAGGAGQDRLRGLDANTDRNSHRHRGSIGQRASQILPEWALSDLGAVGALEIEDHELIALEFDSDVKLAHAR